MSTDQKPLPHGFAFHDMPNTAANRALIKRFRAFLNRDRYDMVVRGNGPRVAPAVASGQHPKRYRQSLPLPLSKSLRVYMVDRVTREQNHREWLKQNDRINVLTKEVRQHNDTLRTALFERDCARKEAESHLLAFHRLEATLVTKQAEVNRVNRRLNEMPRLSLWIESLFNYFKRG